MKALYQPIPIACLLIAIVGAVLSNVMLVVLGMIGAVASIGFASARSAQDARNADPAETLGAESRLLLRPVKRLAEEIASMADCHKGDPALRSIGEEAAAEARRLLADVARTLAARDQLAKALRGRAEAEKDIGEARMRLEFAGDAERASLNAAIAARSEELKHYDAMKDNMKRIEVGVTRAEAALAEMKARLAVGAAGETAEEDASGDLRATIERLKGLSSSYEESVQFLRGETKT